MVKQKQHVRWRVRYKVGGGRRAELIGGSIARETHENEIKETTVLVGTRRRRRRGRRKRRKKDKEMEETEWQEGKTNNKGKGQRSVVGFSQFRAFSTSHYLVQPGLLVLTELNRV